MLEVNRENGMAKEPKGLNPVTICFTLFAVYIHTQIAIVQQIGVVVSLNPIISTVLTC